MSEHERYGEREQTLKRTRQYESMYEIGAKRTSLDKRDRNEKKKCL